MPQFTVAEISEQLGEAFEGDGSRIITGVGEITAAKEGILSFVANPKYINKIRECKASALIIPTDLETEFRPVIRSMNPYLTFTRALGIFHAKNRPLSGGVHPTSKVADDVQLGSESTVMAHAIVDRGAVIGDRSVIYPGCFVGKNAVIGNDVTLYPHVSVTDGCHIEDLCILHGGCRIGSNRSPFEIGGGIPVTLGRDIELGANVVIAGCSELPTVIGEGTKIDNLVQVGFGVTMGIQCIVVAQVSISDNTDIGDYVVIAGQVVINGNLSIGPRSRIGAKSVVQTDVPADADFWGDPAQPINKEKRLKANLLRLPRLFEKIQSIEDRFNNE